ncbi:MAG: TRAP transporter substrate-binding protein [Ferrovibrio sp.]|uniref:TRAP transporter substrate-binding protein n=1 Tax=Ferrovibrio sp. TaxID=1917215 RepID=UPI0026117033|nr:TRAP transporter substrate-binding protein [Ferrovibrio sp.]MCW0232583.1 TRAP transporter substrate-binding protein [Ferrovibrio sp.]
MKKMLILSVALLALIATDLCAQTLRIAHVAPPTSSFQAAAIRFEHHLAQLSNRTMNVEVYPAGQLGSIGELWGQVRAGSVDIQLIDFSAVLFLKSAKDFSVLSIPYAIRDQAHWRSYLKSDLFREMAQVVENAEGLVYLGYLGDRPPRALTTRATPVRSVSDMRGLKIRVPETPAFIRAFEAFGASPTPVKAAELYNALQTGLVDGQDNGIIDVVAAGYTEVQKYYMPIDYMQSGIALWMNGKTFSKLSGNQQQWLREACLRTEADQNASLAREMTEAMEKARSKGMEIVTVDLSGFRNAGERLLQEQDGKAFAAGLGQRIAKIK